MQPVPYDTTLDYNLQNIYIVKYRGQIIKILKILISSEIPVLVYTDTGREINTVHTVYTVPV